MPTTVNYRFVLKRDTAANFAAANTLLLQGELGLETDTKLVKLGDGTTAWNTLLYWGGPLTALLDAQFGNAQGSILYRDSGQWKALAPGSIGNVLQTNGVGANPAWATPSGGLGSGLPATIPDLWHWIETDNILAAAGVHIPYLQGRTPWNQSISSTLSASAGPPVSSTQLNGLNVLTFNNSSANDFALAPGTQTFKKHTCFIVFKPSNLTSGASFISGATGALNIQMSTTGKLAIAKDSVVGIATATSGFSLATWGQANCTYDDSTGAYGFRFGQAAAGSGSVTPVTITAATSGLGYNVQNGTGTELMQGDLAALITYNRVLTLTEIQAVEAYLHSKWNV